VHRRTLLQLFAGIAVAGVPTVAARRRDDRIVIAGGGMLGAHLAYELAKRGADVTLIEKDVPGSGATSKSFAWINATFSKQPWAYYQLNRLGMLGWRHLDRELTLPIRWGGSIEWYAAEKEAADLRRRVGAHQAWGYPAASIGEARLKQLEPKVTFGAVAGAAHAEDEGHVDPVAAVHVLIKEAERLGARVLTGTGVSGLDVAGGRLRAVKTNGGEVPATVLVVACGTETPRVAALAGVRVPLKDSPGVLVHTSPLPPLLNRVVLAPGAHMKQKPDGRIVTGVGFGGTPTTDASREGGERFLHGAAAGVLSALKDAAVDRVTLGWRPLPQDEYPIVGFAPGRRDVYITVMHSGVTLSPFVSRAAAVEILDGVDVEPLAPYRLARFAN
jgi:glycine/D-amino acid oxidase-like deaminating enzyme